jgi:nucleoside-diphosphate-sugar epimerase
LYYDIGRAEVRDERLRAFQPETCVHCAWYAEPGKYLESRRNIACVRDGLLLLDALAAAGCERAVYVGTCAEYDTSLGYLHETSATGPATLYAASKLALHVAASRLAKERNIDLTWARLFHIFGPAEDPRRLVPSLILTLLSARPYEATDGGQVRDYLHVDDVASALTALAVQGLHGTFNVCSGEPVIVRSLIQQVADFLEVPDLVRFGQVPRPQWDPPFICGDSSKLRSSTGWEPKDLAGQLLSTAEWWRASGAVRR